MNILLASSEVVPFAKTGGLADVCGALPIELARAGNDMAVIMPAYRKAQYSGLPIEPLGIHFIVPVGSKMVAGHLLKSHLPDSDVPVYLVQQDQYFDRDELYAADGADYIDNCERFVFFCRAVIEAIRLLDLKVDLIHANDWQTGLIPAYLKTEYRGVPGYEQIATLFTIHNLAYQGQFWHWDMLVTGLDWKHFNWQEMEFHGMLNLMKTGLVFADAINTVSPRYAEEIQSAPLGCGLEGVLQQRAANLSGILNGIDVTQWDPAADPHIAANYDATNFAEGKAACKAALQEEMGLPVREDVPLIGLISRLADQKGLNLVEEVIQRWVQSAEAQWVILGTGELKYHALFETLRERFPQMVAAELGFSNPLAHRIEAGSDIFLMPSLYEPCGLNQFYSLRYGTVPVVRATGGLADSITDAGKEPPFDAAANGFSFEQYNSRALGEALTRAVNAYGQKDAWNTLIATGMTQDWSWGRSAGEYLKLYHSTVMRAKRAVTVQ